MIRSLMVLVAIVLCACGDRLVTAPTVAALAAWSPYLGVHQFDWRLNRQQPHLAPLMDSGSVRGIRVDYVPTATERVAQWALARGAEDVLAILPNESLRDSPCEALASAVARAPSAQYWEIGNEVSHFIDMTPEEYAGIFSIVADCAAMKHPDIVVMPAAPIGNAGGQDFLRRALDAGLLRLAVAGRLPLLAIHYYSTESSLLYGIKQQIQRLPPLTEVWVTETGVDSVDRHLPFVEREYPRMRSALRATRIYWYVFSDCSAYSLVRGLEEHCGDAITYSPLYEVLRRSTR